MQDSIQENASLPQKVSFFYGWVIVGIAPLALFFSGPGQTYSVLVFIDSYVQTFQWDDPSCLLYIQEGHC